MAFGCVGGGEGGAGGSVACRSLGGLSNLHCGESMAFAFTRCCLLCRIRVVISSKYPVVGVNLESESTSHVRREPPIVREELSTLPQCLPGQCSPISPPRPPKATWTGGANAAIHAAPKSPRGTGSGGRNSGPGAGARGPEPVPGARAPCSLLASARLLSASNEVHKARGCKHCGVLRK